ncbi:MAG: DUF3786 domain-containing protein [Oscillospiraceae bacterium]|nr:DUF3786 domain-containing protein [Oscillospiraceae bacterium]
MKQNWEISFEYHLDRFRKIDPEEASRRTGILFYPEKSCFTFNVFGFPLIAEWPEFKLSIADVSKEDSPGVHLLYPYNTLCSFQMQVLTMRVLTEGVSAPQTGNFKAYRELPWGDVYDHNFSGRCIKRFAYSFGFKPEIFEKTAQAINGIKLTLGDVSYEFDFLGGIKCRFVLWKPDDEFPPSAQILFSDNAVLMYNAEDLAVAGDVIITALKEMS